MIRTFHSKIDKRTLCLCLLPSTVLTVYFFWVKMPLLALFFMIFAVFVVERLIHTMYTFTDDGFLMIRQGRFSKVCRIDILLIENAGVVKSSFVTPLRSRHTVMLTLRGGEMKLITPFPAEEFCKYLNRVKSDILEKSYNEKNKDSHD